MYKNRKSKKVYPESWGHSRKTPPVFSVLLKSVYQRFLKGSPNSTSSNLRRKTRIEHFITVWYLRLSLLVRCVRYIRNFQGNIALVFCSPRQGLQAEVTNQPKRALPPPFLSRFGSYLRSDMPQAVRTSQHHSPLARTSFYFLTVLLPTLPVGVVLIAVR